MLDNDVSLTVRIPKSLSDKLISKGKSIGFTRTNFIRIAIHQFLSDTQTDLSSVNNSSYTDKPTRFVLNLNAGTYALLEQASAAYKLSINAVILRVCILVLEYYSKLLT